MRCDDVAVYLSESAEGTPNLPRNMARHVDQCLRCQAEQVQYRRIRRAMLNLRGSLVEPGPGLFAEIMHVVDSADLDADATPLRGSDLRRVAYVAAATAATAATAAGAIVLASRSKRPAS